MILLDLSKDNFYAANKNEGKSSSTIQNNVFDVIDSANNSSINIDIIDKTQEK